MPKSIKYPNTIFRVFRYANTNTGARLKIDCVLSVFTCFWTIPSTSISQTSSCMSGDISFDFSWKYTFWYNNNNTNMFSQDCFYGARKQLRDKFLVDGVKTCYCFKMFRVDMIVNLCCNMSRFGRLSVNARLSMYSPVTVLIASINCVAG